MTSAGSNASRGRNRDPPVLDAETWRTAFAALAEAFAAVGTAAPFDDAAEAVAAAIVLAGGEGVRAPSLFIAEGLRDDALRPAEQADSRRLAGLWAGFPELSDRQRAWLDANGVSGCALARAGGLRTATLDPCDAGWSYEGTPRPAIVQRALTVLATETALSPACLDLVAWDPRAPDAWWLYRGTVDWLGEWEVSAARDGGTVVLQASPLDWLRADCEGAVLLSPCAGLPAGGRESDDRFLRLLLEGVGAVQCPPGWGEGVFAALRKRPRERTALPEVFERDDPPCPLRAAASAVLARPAGAGTLVPERRDCGGGAPAPSQAAGGPCPAPEGVAS